MLRTELIKGSVSDGTKLLIALHGLGDSMEGYRWIPEALQLPKVDVLLVDAPDAYYGGYSWYDFSGEPAEGIVRSRKMLFDLMDDMEGKGYLTEDVVLFGFSQGSLMTLEVGLLYPRLFAGLVGVSGYVHEPERLIKEMSPYAKQQKFLVTHGTKDPLIPIKDVKKQISQLQGAGLNIQWHQFEKAHTIAGVEEIRLIRTFVEKSLLG